MKRYDWALIWRDVPSLTVTCHAVFGWYHWEIRPFPKGNGGVDLEERGSGGRDWEEKRETAVSIEDMEKKKMYAESFM